MDVLADIAHNLPVVHNELKLQGGHRREAHTALKEDPLSMRSQHNLTVAWHRIPQVGDSPGHSQGSRLDPRWTAVYGPVDELWVHVGPAACRLYASVLIVEQVGSHEVDMKMPGGVRPNQRDRFPPRGRHLIDH